jgi:hypothetical protein
MSTSTRYLITYGTPEVPEYERYAIAADCGELYGWLGYDQSRRTIHVDGGFGPTIVDADRIQVKRSVSFPESSLLQADLSYRRISLLAGKSHYVVHGNGYVHARALWPFLELQAGGSIHPKGILCLVCRYEIGEVRLATHQEECLESWLRQMKSRS